MSVQFAFCGVGYTNPAEIGLHWKMFRTVSAMPAMLTTASVSQLHHLKSGWSWARDRKNARIDVFVSIRAGFWNSSVWASFSRCSHVFIHRVQKRHIALFSTMSPNWLGCLRHVAPGRMLCRRIPRRRSLRPRSILWSTPVLRCLLVRLCPPMLLI